MNKVNPVNGDEMLEFLNKCNIFDLKMLEEMLINQTKKLKDEIYDLKIENNRIKRKIFDLEELKSSSCKTCKHNRVCFINTKVNQVAIVQGLETSDFSCSLWDRK